ncbi:MAG: tetratricopeptide repeat protein [Pseudomonadota bacterium]
MIDPAALNAAQPSLSGIAALTPGVLRRVFAVARFRKAEAMIGSGSAEAAVAIAFRGLAWDPDSARGWTALAAAHDALGRLPKAIEALKRATERAGPSEGEPFHQLGMAQRKSGDFEAAIRAFQTAIERDPNHEAARKAAEALAPVSARLARRREMEARRMRENRRDAG